MKQNLKKLTAKTQTVEFHNSKSHGVRVLFLIISSSNNRKIDVKINKPKNDCYPTYTQWP